MVHRHPSNCYHINAFVCALELSDSTTIIITIYHDLHVYHNSDSITIVVGYNFLAYDGSTKVSRMCSMPVDLCVESCIYM